jgi:hypothetical protein
VYQQIYIWFSIQKENKMKGCCRSCNSFALSNAQETQGPPACHAKEKPQIVLVGKESLYNDFCIALEKELIKKIESDPNEFFMQIWLYG